MTALTLLAALFVIFISTFAIQRLFLFRQRVIVPNETMSRLQELAKRSLASLDVPVGAVLLYKNEIIGEGYNTVLQNKKAGEHAEINAISSAILSLGMEQFSALDRRHLILISTFEPCLMCAGAFVNHNIRIVYFFEEKDAEYLLKERRHYMRYLFRRALVRNKGEQVALFKLHPGYPKQK